MSRLTNGKTSKSRSQRRNNPGINCTAPDGETDPFGAMVHMDHLAMEADAEAAAAARYCLNLLDEKTGVFGAFPCAKKN